MGAEGLEGVEEDEGAAIYKQDKVNSADSAFILLII